jgi:transcriptional regulator with XRE-family HTH domain
MQDAHPLKLELVRRGITQTDFARDVRCTRSALSQICNRRLTPWPALKARISDALGMSEADLFAADDPVAV